MNYTASPDLAQAVFEACPDAQLLLDASGERVLDANGAAQRLCGFALRDLIKTPIRELLRRGGRPGIGALAELTARPFWPYIVPACRLRTFQPTARVRVDAVVTRLAIKPTPYLLLTLQPCRARSEKVRVGWRKLRRMVSGVAPCLWSATTNQAGEVRFELVSPAAERVTGRPAKHLGEGLHRWRAIVHPFDLDLWEQAWAKRLAGRETHDEFRVVWPDGSANWVAEGVRVESNRTELRLFGTIALTAPSRLVKRGVPKSIHSDVAPL